MAAKAIYDETRSSGGECESCHHPIIWRYNMTTSKSSPWDPPTRCDECGETPTGRIHETMITAPGAAKASRAKCDGRGRIWISHFATCAFAERHRR